MRKALILRSHANEIFRMVEEAGLSPDRFHWTEVANGDGLTVSELQYPERSFHFRFDLLDGKHYCTFAPGLGCPVQSEFPGSWPGQRDYAKRWLAAVKMEVESPDLWSSVAAERALTRAAGEEEKNDPFSPVDVKRIHESLGEIREYLRSTLEVSESHFSTLESRLLYLEEAATRLGRKDWMNLTVGVLMNIAIGLSLAPDSARELFRFAGQALRWLLDGAPMLP